MAKKERAPLQRGLERDQSVSGNESSTKPHHEELVETLRTVSSALEAEPVLRSLALALVGMDSLAKETCRSEAAAALKQAKIQGGVRLLDAALSTPSRRADEPKELGLPDPEPWESEVDGCELLSRISATVLEHVSMPVESADTVALWVVFARAIDRFCVAPNLLVTSATRECGKSTLLDVLYSLVPKPLPASDLTGPVVFRTVEVFKPTLLVDEMDRYLDGNSGLIGILNASHHRTGAQAVRLVGDKHEPKLFSTWCPKVLAMIGKPPDTILSRSVEVRLHRKPPHVRVRQLRLDQRGHLEALGRMGRRFVDDRGDAIREAEPKLPDFVANRQADNWRPLLAIAEVAGGEWPYRAASALAALARRADEDLEPAIQLLFDLQDLFDEIDADFVTSADVVRYLGSMEDRPWAAWGWRGDSIQGPGVAGLLKKFEIRPMRHRVGGRQSRGYLRRNFEERWVEYSDLRPAHPMPESSRPSQVKSDGHAGESRVVSAVDSDPSRDRIRDNTLETRDDWSDDPWPTPGPELSRSETEVTSRDEGAMDEDDLEWL